MTITPIMFIGEEGNGKSTAACYMFQLSNACQVPASVTSIAHPIKKAATAALAQLIPRTTLDSLTKEELRPLWCAIGEVMRKANPGALADRAFRLAESNFESEAGLAIFDDVRYLAEIEAAGQYFGTRPVVVWIRKDRGRQSPDNVIEILNSRIDVHELFAKDGDIEKIFADTARIWAGILSDQLVNQAKKGLAR